MPTPTDAARWLQASPPPLSSALAALSVSAGPIPPFQMVAMTFALGASIGIVRAVARGIGWRGLFGYHAF